MESILYIIAGISSFTAAYFFGRNKWDGLLQWLLVFQNSLIGGIMFLRAFEFWHFANSTSITLISSSGLLISQTAIAIFLYLNMRSVDSTFRGKKGEQGIQGAKGDRGEQGEQGERGNQGNQGEPCK